MPCGPDCCWCRCVRACRAWAGERPAGTLGAISGIKALSPTAATTSHSWLCVCLCVCFGRFGATAHVELFVVYVPGTWAPVLHPRRSASAAAVADVAGSLCWPACLHCNGFQHLPVELPVLFLAREFGFAQRRPAQHNTGRPAAAAADSYGSTQHSLPACGQLLRRRRHAVCRCCWVAGQALSFTQEYACSSRSMLAAACAATPADRSSRHIAAHWTLSCPRPFSVRAAFGRPTCVRTICVLILVPPAGVCWCRQLELAHPHSSAALYDATRLFYEPLLAGFCAGEICTAGAPSCIVGDS